MRNRKSTSKDTQLAKIEMAMSALCIVEDVLWYEIEVVADQDHTLNFELCIECLHLEPLTLVFPVMAVALQSENWLCHQLLEACGWRKDA